LRTLESYLDEMWVDLESLTILTNPRLPQQSGCCNALRTGCRSALITYLGMIRPVRSVADRAFDLAIGAERKVASPTDFTRVLFAERLTA